MMMITTTNKNKNKNKKNKKNAAVVPRASFVLVFGKSRRRFVLFFRFCPLNPKP